MVTEDAKLADLCVEARVRAHLTQGELAEKMGTSQSAVARLESGKAKPTLGTLRRLAKATGMKLEITLVPLRKKATIAQP